MQHPNGQRPETCYSKTLTPHQREESALPPEEPEANYTGKRLEFHKSCHDRNYAAICCVGALRTDEYSLDLLVSPLAVGST